MTNKQKHIIALSGSPSKGRNSDSMLDAFIEGIKENDPNILIEKIYICDLNIDNYCFENSMGTGEHEKIFNEIATQINSIDGLILATPTYNFSVPAGVKNFIDRLRFVALDMKKRNIFNQPIGQLKHPHLFFIVSGGTPKWIQKFIFLIYPTFWLRIIFLYYGSRKMRSFYSGDIRTFENKKILKKCKVLGQKFSKRI